MMQPAELKSSKNDESHGRPHIQAPLVLLLLLLTLTVPSLSHGLTSVDDAAEGGLADASGAADSPSSAGASGRSLNAAPIGSGDNILDFNKRVKDLKGYYKDALKYLGPDDTVLILGYIVRLERLEVQYFLAFPIGDLLLYQAQLSLTSRLINVVSRGLRVAKNAVELSGRILTLTIAVERARIAGVDASQIRPAPPGPPGVQDMSPVFIVSSDAATRLTSSAQDISGQYLPLALGSNYGGAPAPMALARSLLTEVDTTLQRLKLFQAPTGLLTAGPVAGLLTTTANALSMVGAG